MGTRKIKDAKDLDTGELIYIKGHAKATYMSDGRTVEDAINAGGGGGEVVIKDNIYVATFSTEDLEALRDDTASVLSIPIDFIRAITDKKTILMPTGRGYGNGYAVVTEVSGYIGVAFDTAAVTFSVLVGRNIISVDVDNDIVDDALLITPGDISIEVIPDSKNYITIDIDLEDLRFTEDGFGDSDIGVLMFQIQNSWEELLQAVASGKRIAIMYYGTPIFMRDVWTDDLIYCRFTNPATQMLYDVEIGDQYIDFNKVARINYEGIETRILKYVSDGVQKSVAEEIDRLDTTTVKASNLNTINGQVLTGGIDIEVTGEKEVVATFYNAFGSLQPNKIYHITNYVTQDLSISEFVTRRRSCDEYEVHFITGDTVGRILFPTGANIKWANGEVPTLEPNTAYELSVVGGIMIDDTRIYKAVLTPFK